MGRYTYFKSDQDTKKEKPRLGKEIELTKALQDFIKDKGRLDVFR